ncbi:phage tail protein [Oceanobacter sp. 4_MG-2023]|uniref:phage tail protein n=1 Tax=Oceanobacter sp. 4_MG-2023 TaxID=3062623 RepID=UPI0027341B9B|nr:phage tail protein [Oceanobacter sp. 4_MG-2023]MDP2548893.1 phage tail protein [Oceanobacter sp. 4_MG-2023]
MQTLDSLAALIHDNRQLLGITRQGYDLWIDSGTIEPGSNRETERGLHFCDYRYRLALSIDAMHGHRGGLLLAMLHNWETSLSREVRADLDEPQIITSTATKNRGGRILQVEYTLDVRDGIYLTRDSNGPVQAIGDRWTFGEHTLNIAEAISLTSEVRT